METITSVLVSDYIIIAILSSLIVEIIKDKAHKQIDSLKAIAMVLLISIILSVLHGVLLVHGGAFSGAIIMQAVEQGILCGAIAVFGFDVLKSITSKKQNNKPTE